MHICFASLDYPDETSGGGVGLYVQTIGHELVRKGHRVSVVALKKTKNSPDVTDDHGVKIYRVRPGNCHWYISKVPLVGNIFALPIREIEYSQAVVRAIVAMDTKDRVDIVEGTETGGYFLFKLRSGIKTVIRLHGERYTFAKYTAPGKIPVDVRISRFFQRRAFKRVDMLTSPGKSHANEIRTEIGDEGPSIEVIPNPFMPVHDYSKRDIPDPARPVFLYVGRLQANKGFIDFLKAAPYIIEKSPHASFILAGSEHPSIKSEKIEAMINELGIRPAIRILGHVSSAELNALYHKATAVVLPSYYETFSYSCLEAIMSAVPVVAYKIGAVSDLIGDGENGFLVTTGDIEALSNACLRAIHLEIESSDQDTYGIYNVNRVCHKMISLYEKLLYSGEIPLRKKVDG
jgi:glycosyltransferase involved in cell wall biosynthesis